MRASAPPSNLLGTATDRFGRTPEEWLAAGLAGLGGPVLDLRCAVDHLARSARRVAVRRLPTWDPDGTTSGPSPSRWASGRAGTPIRALTARDVVVGEAGELPVRTNGAAGAAAVMCLPNLEPLDAFFAELRRVLRPTGTLAALVPSASRPLEPMTWPRSARAALTALTGALRGHPGFRNGAARDRVSWLFASADFAVLADHRRVFWLEIADPATAASAVTGLVAAGAWPPDVEPSRIRCAAAALAEVAAPGVRLPLPLRLVLGRR